MPHMDIVVGVLASLFLVGYYGLLVVALYGAMR